MARAKTLQGLVAELLTEDLKTADLSLADVAKNLGWETSHLESMIRSETAMTIKDVSDIWGAISNLSEEAITPRFSFERTDVEKSQNDNGVMSEEQAREFVSEAYPDAVWGDILPGTCGDINLECVGVRGCFDPIDICPEVIATKCNKCNKLFVVYNHNFADYVGSMRQLEEEILPPSKQTENEVSEDLQATVTVREFVKFCEENDLSFTVGLIKGKAAHRNDGIVDIVAFACQKNSLVIPQIGPLWPATGAITADGLAAAFYAEHREKTFYQDIVDSLKSPVTGDLGARPFVVLSKGATDWRAVSKWREVIGATDSRTAEFGTLRSMFGEHRFNPHAAIADNAFHGSDSRESAIREFGILLENSPYWLGVPGDEYAGMITRRAQKWIADGQIDSIAPKSCVGHSEISRDLTLLRMFNAVQEILVKHNIPPSQMRASITHGGIEVVYDKLLLRDPAGSHFTEAYNALVKECGSCVVFTQDSSGILRLPTAGFLGLKQDIATNTNLALGTFNRLISSMEREASLHKRAAVICRNDIQHFAAGIMRDFLDVDIEKLIANDIRGTN